MMKAADSGYDNAMLQLGRVYEFGRHVPKDLNKAIYWYRQAAEHGNIEAQYWLGARYEQGAQGLPKDIDKALFWLRKAADHDDDDPRQNFAEQSLMRLEKREPPRHF